MSSGKIGNASTVLFEIGLDQYEELKNRIKYEEKRKNVDLLDENYEVIASTCEREFNIKSNQNIADDFHIYSTPSICEDNCGFILDHAIFRTLPKRKCLHESCEDGDTEYGYCEHSICRKFLDREGNNCGTHKHQLIYKILDNSKSKQTCEALFFGEKVRMAVSDVVSVLQDKENGIMWRNY